MSVADSKRLADDAKQALRPRHPRLDATDGGAAQITPLPGNGYRPLGGGVGNHGPQGPSGTGPSTEDIAGPSAQVAVSTGASFRFLAGFHSGTTTTHPGFAAGHNPSLQPYLTEAADKTYGDGARLASKEFGLPLGHLPEELPYRLDHLLDDDWLPERPWVAISQVTHEGPSCA